MKSEKVLVTGSEGFIGSHLVEKLISQGFNVKALVHYNSFGNYGWLEEIDGYKKKYLEIVMGDIRDSYGIKKIVKGCESVFHLAALIAIPYSYKSVQSYIDTNISGTTNLLLASRDLNIKKFIHTSTSEVYGTAQYIPIDESHPLNGQSPYSASKIGADQIAMSFYNSFDTPVTILRPFNTFGPRQSARAIIPTIISQIASNQKEIYLGSLSPTRDFMYVSDTVNGFYHAYKNKSKNGEVINIGSGYEITMKDLVKTISNIMQTKINIRIDKKRIRPINSEVKRLLCNNKKAKKTIKWVPKFSGKTGLRKSLSETINWYSDPVNLNKFKSKIYNL